ncbi:MAG: flagellar type III secretion system pore protein FliP [Armatimonadota bacterium]|jgi:flagellar biosynthetic protein FliP
MMSEGAASETRQYRRPPSGRCTGVALAAFGLVAVLARPAYAQEGLGRLLPDLTASGEALGAKLIVLVTILALAPAFLAMVTSFTRIVVVLYFLRSALGAGDVPPSQVLLGLALFLTFFTMRPTLEQINENAVQPYLSETITAETALRNAEAPLRVFMFRHARTADIALFVRLAKLENVERRGDVPTSLLIPAFIISELLTAFQIGFIIYLPFVVIDLVVAGTLVSVGVFMLPPVLLSLPFKVLLFILVDGWRLLTASLLQGFY